MAKDDEWDFGFSFVSDEEMKQREQELSMKLETVSVKNEERFNQLKSLFVIFLNNMLEHPERPYIYWPQRVLKIREVLDRINKI